MANTATKTRLLLSSNGSDLMVVESEISVELIQMRYVGFLNLKCINIYISDVIRQCQGQGGIAFGAGNSIPDYVPPEGYISMIEIVKELRGDLRN